MNGEWEQWDENQWYPYGWCRCDHCPDRATWIKWDREAAIVERACDTHHPR